MSSTLTLLTSDTPPISIQASRIHLQAGSKVFSDMLSLPSSSSEDNSVTLAETEKEIRAFLEVVQGEGGKKGGEVEKLDEEGWENLARLADKFDSPVVMQLIEKRIWKKSPLHTFTLATFVNKRELLTLTAYFALGVKDRESTRFGASSEWKDRLDAYKDTRKAQIPDILKRVNKVLSDSYCYSHNMRCAEVNAFQRALLASLNTLQLDSTIWLASTSYPRQPCSNGYASCGAAEENALAALNAAWQKAPVFPYGE